MASSSNKSQKSDGDDRSAFEILEAATARIRSMKNVDSDAPTTREIARGISILKEELELISKENTGLKKENSALERENEKLRLEIAKLKLEMNQIRLNILTKR
jgi:predicted RNase H-like nuclease (RuvC/YqgF family)